MFITKRLKLFLKQILQCAIPSYSSFLTSHFDICCVIFISKSKNWAANELVKQKIIDYHIKDALSDLRQFVAIESPLKMMKNAFYFP